MSAAFTDQIIDQRAISSASKSLKSFSKMDSPSLSLNRFMIAPKRLPSFKKSSIMFSPFCYLKR